MALLLAAAFVATAERLKSAPRQSVSAEIQVALPVFVQVLMSIGDRYLAANIAAIRGLVVSTEKMHPDEYAILAKVQKDVSWLNPAHEDNYYVAFAVLPDHGEVDAAQTILKRAGRVRYFDYQPAFFYAFDLYFLKHDPVAAAEWLRHAAERLPDADQQLTMQNMAARWIDKADDLDLAIRVVEGMARQAKRPDFRKYLEMRVDRLHMLKHVRAAADEFRAHAGRPVSRPEELVEAGLLPVLPRDPFGFGFEVDRQGRIMLRTSPPKS